MECHPKIIYYILSCAQCPGILTLTGPAENIGMVGPNQIFKKIVLLLLFEVLLSVYSMQSFMTSKRFRWKEKNESFYNSLL